MLGSMVKIDPWGDLLLYKLYLAYVGMCTHAGFEMLIGLDDKAASFLKH